MGLTCRLFPKRGFFMKFSGALSCEVADEAVVALVTLLPSSLKRRSICSQHFTRLREARRRRPVRGARRCRGGVPRAPVPPCPPPHKDRRRSWTSRCHGAGAALCRAGRGGVGPSTADACTLLQVGAELLTPWQLPSLERRRLPPGTFPPTLLTPRKSDCLPKCGLRWGWLANALDWRHGGEMKLPVFTLGTRGGHNTFIFLGSRRVQLGL